MGRGWSLVAIGSPFGLILLAAVRLIVVANYSTTTAVAIASSGGYVNAFLGSVIPLVPIFLPYLALILILAGRFLLGALSLVAAALITPAPISLPAALRLASTDWEQINVLIAHYGPQGAICATVILFLLWGYRRNPSTSTNTVVATVSMIIIFLWVLAFVPAETSPVTLRPVALTIAHLTGNTPALVAEVPGYWIATVWALIAACVVVVLMSRPRRPGKRPPEGRGVHIGRDDRDRPTQATIKPANPQRPPRPQREWPAPDFLWMGSVLLSAVAVLVLAPYITSLYPIPNQPSYYAGVVHAMWLPAEKITLKYGPSRYGYVLASDQDWFTILTVRNRTIAYIHTRNIARRHVCQPPVTDQPLPRPPLVTTLYNRPKPTPRCLIPTTRPATGLSRRPPQQARKAVRPEGAPPNRLGATNDTHAAAAAA
jgi:hypothetical protein